MTFVLLYLIVAAGLLGWLLSEREHGDLPLAVALVVPLLWLPLLAVALAVLAVLLLIRAIWP